VATPEQIQWLNVLGVTAFQGLAGSSPGGPPPGFSISATVGRGGKNKPDDVTAVQAALNKAANAGLDENGNCDAKTIAAIIAFQKSLGQPKPDGLVEPGKGTAKALARAASAPSLSTSKTAERLEKLTDDQKLHFELSSEERAKVNQYLDAHLSMVPREGAGPSGADSYQPALDDKPATEFDVVEALLPLTMAGSMSPDGQDPMYRDALSDLTNLVQERIKRLTLEVIENAVAEKIADAPGEAGDWIKQFLAECDLKPNLVDDDNTQVMFKGKTTPIMTVINATLRASKDAKFKYGEATRTAVTEDLVLKVAMEVLDDARPKAPKARPGEPDSSTQLVIGVMFLPTQLHHDVRTGENTSDPSSVQVQGNYTFQFHKNGDGGFEHSFVVQAQFMYDSKKRVITEQPMIGTQEALVTRNFFKNFLQLQAFVQFLSGETIEEGVAIKGPTITCVRTKPTGQGAAGVQAVFTIPKTGEHLQVVLQAQMSSTDTGGVMTVDKSLGIGLQWQF
jgi:peptidoglycan hydrolase-like protein with peptidoglycan-binding domain